MRYAMLALGLLLAIGAMPRTAVAQCGGGGSVRYYLPVHAHHYVATPRYGHYYPAAYYYAPYRHHSRRHYR